MSTITELKKLRSQINGLASIMRAKLAEQPASLSIELNDDNIFTVAEQVGREREELRRVLLSCAYKVRALAAIYTELTGETPSGVRNVLEVTSKVLAKFVQASAASAGGTMGLNLSTTASAEMRNRAR